MDPRSFDRLTASVSRRRSRRATLRLLTGGLLGGLLAQRGSSIARAAQPIDRDQDGLYDDDEESIYRTNPDVIDTDGDGLGDGEEVYYGTDPRVPDGQYGEAIACSPELASCNGGCVDLAFDPLHCGQCGNVCTGGDGYQGVCSFGVCSLATIPSVPVPIGDVGGCVRFDAYGNCVCYSVDSAGNCVIGVGG